MTSNPSTERQAHLSADAGSPVEARGIPPSCESEAGKDDARPKGAALPDSDSGGRTDRAVAAYAATVFVVALFVLVPLVHLGLSGHPLTALLLAGLATLAGARPVSISSLKTEVVATHPFVFCALAAVGPQAAALVAVAGVLGATLRQGHHLRWIRAAFNLGAVVLSTAVASLAFWWAGGETGAGVFPLMWPLGAATVAYFMTNTGLVAVAISLEKGQSFISTWTQSFQWTTVSFFTGFTLAVFLVVVLETVGHWGLALGIPPCWLLYAFYRAHKERLEEQERRLQVIKDLNVELERRVEERTHELQAAVARIEELQAMKETLTHTLIHDLKNPLSAVVGNLDLLERMSEGDALRMVRRSKDGTSRLLRMIMDLLDIARLEEKRLTPQLQPVDAAQLVRDSIEQAEPTAMKSRVQLRFDAPSEPCLLQADASLIQRVVDNLLANAVQHSPSGGTVTVSLAAPGDDGIEVAVADEGPGIPEEYREKIFEKYARLDMREAGMTANRGLGLTFCRLAVEAHGGSIRAEGTPGAGALFRMTLPRNDIPVGASTGADARQQASGNVGQP